CLLRPSGERAMCVRMDGVMRPWLSARATRSSGNPGRVTSGSHPKRQSRADCPRQERPMTPMTVSVPGKKTGSPSRGIFTGSRREPSPSQTMREGMSRIFRRNERAGDAHFGVAVFGDADEKSADTWALEQERVLETGIPSATRRDVRKAVATASRASFVIRTAPGRSRGSIICVVVVRRVFSFCASAVESAYSRVVFPPAPMRVMLRLVSRCSCCMSVRAKDADMSVPFLLVKIPPEIYTYFNKKKRKKKYLLKKSIKVREISIFVISPVPALQRRERFARVKGIAGCEIPCRR